MVSLIDFSPESFCTLTYAASAVAAVVALKVLISRRKKRESSFTKKRLRSTSIGSSALMASGVLPAGSPYDSIINIALWYDKLPTVESLKAVFTESILPYERFHSLPIQTEDCGPITWVCQKVDIDKHFYERRNVERVSTDLLESEGFQATAEGAVRREAEKILNTLLTTKAEGRPWWEVHFIEAPSSDDDSRKGKATPPPRPAGMVLIRIHHAIGDGVSLMEMFADVVHNEEGSPISSQNLFTPARGAGASRLGLLSRLIRAMAYSWSAVTSFLYILQLAAVGMDTACAFQNSSRQLPYQPNRFTVYFPSHSLALVKQIKEGLSKERRASITVNDVEFALFAGALRRFLIRHGEDPEKVSLRALTPFAVMEPTCHETKHKTLLRNFWTFVANQLPIAPRSAVDRILASNATWSRLKQTALIPVSFVMHRLNSKLPAPLQKQTSNDLMKRISVVFSNVPGPTSRMFFGGEEIQAVHMLFPNVSQQVGILSIHGWMHMALVMSTCHSPAVTRRWLSECFVEELVEAAGAVGVSRMDVMKAVKLF